MRRFFIQLIDLKHKSLKIWDVVVQFSLVKNIVWKKQRKFDDRQKFSSWSFVPKERPLFFPGEICLQRCLTRWKIR